MMPPLLSMRRYAPRCAAAMMFIDIAIDADTPLMMLRRRRFRYRCRCRLSACRHCRRHFTIFRAQQARYYAMR